MVVARMERGGRSSGRGASWGTSLPDSGVDLFLGQVTLWQREQVLLEENGDTT